MNAHFPITKAISADTEIIINALNKRSQEIKKIIDSQSILKRIFLTSLKTFGLASSIITAASIPVAAITFTATPLTLAAISVILAVACLALSILLDPRSPGEAIVKEHWKVLLEAIRKGNGNEIIMSCKELAKQKDVRSSAFAQCLGTLPPNEITPFFHKTCMLGYLLIAMKHLRDEDDEQARSNAYTALSHFDRSDLDGEIESFTKAIVDSPKEIRKLIEMKSAGQDLHALDYLLVLRRNTSL